PAARGRDQRHLRAACRGGRLRPPGGRGLRNGCREGRSGGAVGQEGCPHPRLQEGAVAAGPVVARGRMSELLESIPVAGDGGSEDFRFLAVTTTGHVATVTMRRPPVNAVSLPMYAE